jgi:hypothetical protein
MNATSSTKTATRTVDLGGLEVGDDVFGYIAPPGTITPPPVVLKWVQSLDLAHSLKDCRRSAQRLGPLCP